MYIVLKILIFCLNLLYSFIKIFKIQNKVVLISRQSNEPSKDFKLLLKELPKEYKVVCLCKTLPGGAKAKVKDKILYSFHMIKQMYHLATSKVCIIDSYCPTISLLKHKKQLKIIQMWHSMGTMKKFGYAILDSDEGSYSKIAYAMKMHKNYNYVYASSRAYISHLAKGFNCDENIIKIRSLPRTDLLFDKEYQEKTRNVILKKYPRLKKKKNVLYCPTFRKKEKQLSKAIDELVSEFDFDKYNLIIKLHPLSRINISNKKVIVDKNFSTFDFLSVADKAISDYSCVIYEAGLLNIPLYFYNFDMKKYEDSRGLAIDYKELPGYICGDAKSLVKSLEKPYDRKYLKSFINKYVTNKKNATKTIIGDISLLMNGGDL